MKRAFLICGPGSSGNRLFGAILARAGCWGEGSTKQPKSISELPKDQDVVWVHPGNLEVTIKGLMEIFEVVLVMIVREPEANCRSQLRVGFFDVIEDAYVSRIRSFKHVLTIGTKLNCKVEVVTYEGLSVPMLKLWLSRFKLKINNLNKPLLLPGQNTSCYITNENGKYYYMRDNPSILHL